MQRITSKDPYQEVNDIIEKWARANYYTAFIVTLKIDGEITTEILRFEFDDFAWDNDWYEGGEVYLCGFSPLDEIELFNLAQREREL